MDKLLLSLKKLINNQNFTSGQVCLTFIGFSTISFLIKTI